MKTIVKLPVLLILAVACSAGPVSTLAAAEASLDEARKLYLHGNYGEAQELYGLLAEKEPLAAALGIARCRESIGQRDAAVKTLSEAARQFPKEAALPAALAEIALDRGDPVAAAQWADAALKLDENNLAARFIRAELDRLSGRIDEAEKGYDWFINFYNQTAEFKDPEALRYVGLAAAQFARWNRLHDQFSFLVNDLYPDALQLDENYWPAHLESGLLFLEKYNKVDAEKDFQAALKINPNAAEVHAAIARLALQSYELEKAQQAVDRAIEINPHLLAAHQLKADIEFASFDPAAAEQVLQKALPLCPTSETTLGRLAAARGCVDGLEQRAAGTRIAATIDQVLKRNPHAGDFFEALADSLDTMRRYPEAQHFYEEAIRVMPKLVGAYGKLGLVHMRMGDEQEARTILEKSFEVDFGNVRIKNSLEVLDVLDTYETLETEHFLIRFDSKHDKLLARYMAQFLEDLYPDLCRQLGYFPKDKSLFEVFNKAKNTDGHGWFSARMVGLPHIHTIGACAGKMVAMVSPDAMDNEFNWARVIKHEFVHVINLQQTGFRIPHWFTEALAVYNEGYPRPASWNQMLARRVPAGKTFDLNTINRGFIRPTDSEDWQMAYCQAEMYAEYMIETYGDDALAKMLAGYADNLDTRAAIRRAFEVEQEDFEKGYTAYVKKIVDGITVEASAESRSLSELEKALAENADDPDLLAAVARAYLERKAYPKAGELAARALKSRPKHQAATYVQARLQMLIGNRAGVVALLEEALDRDAPQSNLLQLLAGLKYKAEEYAPAAELYELGRKKFPGDPVWTKLLARVYLKTQDDERLAPLLAEMAMIDGDDLTVRKKLANMALRERDYAAAEKWATQAVQIDVMDADMHRAAGEALVELEKYDKAINEFEVAIELQPRHLQARLALADACIQAGQRDKARQVLTQLLGLDPEFPGADVLLESLDK